MFFKPKPDNKTPADPVEIEIFRAGTFRAMNGKEFTFTAKDVAEIANSFDSAQGPAPVVIGHPKSDDPAYAWANTVFADGDVLKATLKDIDPAFAEMVRAGRYKRISAALYPPDASNNPAPGQYYLRHIGFLGAAAPAVKGLKSVDLAEDDSDWVEFGDPQIDAIAARYELKISAMKTERRIEDMLRQGKIMPWAKKELLCFVAELNDRDVIAFSDDTAKTRMDWFLDYLDCQSPQIPMGKLNLSDDYTEQESVSFTAPDGYSVDQSQMGLLRRAQQKKQETGLCFEDALDLVLETEKKRR